jgi:hypothetical protein
VQPLKKKADSGVAVLEMLENWWPLACELGLVQTGTAELYDW